MNFFYDFSNAKHFGSVIVTLPASFSKTCSTLWAEISFSHITASIRSQTGRFFPFQNLEDDFTIGRVKYLFLIFLVDYICV